MHRIGFNSIEFKIKGIKKEVLNEINGENTQEERKEADDE